MKDLIIIFGDYRTFDITVKSMSPLFNSQVHVIIDVWDRSSSKNKVLGIDFMETVTHDRAVNAITPYLNGALLWVKVTPISECTSDINGQYTQKYNSAYLQRISSAYKDVVASGIQYEKVIAFRPDLFFGDTYYDKNTIQDDFVYVSFLPEPGKRKLSDMCYTMNFSAFIELFKEFNPMTWNKTPIEKDWHEWVFDYFEGHVGSDSILSHADIARPTIQNDDTWLVIKEKAQEWWMAQACEGIQLHGEKEILTFWPSSFLEKAKTRFDGIVYVK